MVMKKCVKHNIIIKVDGERKRMSVIFEYLYCIGTIGIYNSNNNDCNLEILECV